VGAAGACNLFSPIDNPPLHCTQVRTIAHTQGKCPFGPLSQKRSINPISVSGCAYNDGYSIKASCSFAHDYRQFADNPIKNPPLLEYLNHVSVVVIVTSLDNHEEGMVQAPTGPLFSTKRHVGTGASSLFSFIDNPPLLTFEKNLHNQHVSRATASAETRKTCALHTSLDYCWWHTESKCALFHRKGLSFHNPFLTVHTSIGTVLRLLAVSHMTTDNSQII
jgi:hypothetical protein